MDVNVLKKKLAEVLASARAITDAYAGKEADMPKPESEKLAALLGEADECKARLDLAQRMGAYDELMREPGQSAGATAWRKAAPGEGEQPVDPQAWRELKVATLLGERTIRYNVPIAVAEAGKGYAPAFEAYLRKGIAELGPNDRKTLSLGVDTAGGFLSPEDYHTELIRKLMGFTAIRPNARIAQTSRDVARWPRVNYSASDVYTSPARLTWTGESPASSTVHRVTGDTTMFGLLSIPVHTAMASWPVSNDLIEDSAFDVLGLGTEFFGEAFGLGEDDAFINGNGANRPLGILALAEATDGPAVGGTTTVANFSGTTGADALIDLFYSVPAQYRMNGKWVLNSQTTKLVEKFKDGSNRYLVSSLLTGASLATGQVDAIKNKPILTDEFVPDATAGLYPVIFGDLRGYVVLDRVGLSVQRLTERYAEDNLTVLLARKRVGGMLTEPYRVKVFKTT